MAGACGWGNMGKFSVVVCVDQIFPPFGIVTVIALAPAGWMFSQFEASHKKITCASGVSYGE